MTPWTANFDEDGNVTLTPDTPETRADFNDTMHGIATNRFEGVRVVPGGGDW